VLEGLVGALLDAAHGVLPPALRPGTVVTLEHRGDDRWQLVRVINPGERGR
jgi:hypothetical protein